MRVTLVVNVEGDTNFNKVHLRMGGGGVQYDWMQWFLTCCSVLCIYKTIGSIISFPAWHMHSQCDAAKFYNSRRRRCLYVTLFNFPGKQRDTRNYTGTGTADVHHHTDAKWVKSCDFFQSPALGLLAFLCSFSYRIQLISLFSFLLHFTCKKTSSKCKNAVINNRLIK